MKIKKLCNGLGAIVRNNKFTLLFIPINTMIMDVVAGEQHHFWQGVFIVVILSYLTCSFDNFLKILENNEAS